MATTTAEEETEGCDKDNGFNDIEDVEDDIIKVETEMKENRMLLL